MSTHSKAAAPVGAGDLRSEREQFVRSYLHKGAELAEELLHENHNLNEELTRLREDNARLRSQLASNDAIRELLTTIDGLEQDRKALMERTGEIQQRFVLSEQHHSEIERELNDLASLYVASFQLNSTLSISKVIKHMCELLEQLVGAQTFVLYLLSGDATRAVPVGARGHVPGPLAHVSLEDGPIADACLTGVARIGDPEQPRSPGEPVAVLPLVFASEVVGVIALYELLPHKKTWVKVDRELFKLLSLHGATALIASNLYAKEAGPRAALHDVLFHLEAERHRLLSEAEPEVGGDV